MSTREYAEEQACRRSKENPNEYFVAVFQTQVCRWIVVGASSAKACIEGGYAVESQCHGYLRGYCAVWTQTIDTAFVHDGELCAESWIRDQADHKGYEVIEEVDDDDRVVRLVVENMAGDGREVFELPTVMNYQPV